MSEKKAIKMTIEVSGMTRINRILDELRDEHTLAVLIELLDGVDNVRETVLAYVERNLVLAVIKEEELS